MQWLQDVHNRQIRLTDERLEHLENDHPEMLGQIEKMKQTLLNPDRVVKSMTDSSVENFYRFYDKTPVTKKYLCIAVKVLEEDLFIITAYFTDTVKRGDILWEKK